MIFYFWIVIIINYEREDILKDKISGVFHYHNEKASTIIWDDFYKKKEESISRLQEKETGYLEKHILYYYALKYLGFFNKLTISSSVLQLGVGHGQTLRTILEKENIIPYGVDVSFSALSFLIKRKTNKKPSLICADALQLPFRDNSFDRIFEVGVVEHFYEKDPF